MRYMFLLYFIVLFAFSIFTYSFIDINLPFFNLFFTGLGTQNRVLFTSLYILFISLLFAFYIYFLWCSYHKKLVFGALKKVLLLQIIILFFSYPAVLSFDIFNYIFSAKVAFYYFENPYLVMPVEFLGDPNLAFTHAANKIALYGPVWLLFSSIPFFLGFGNLIISVFSFKAFIIFFYIACIYFIRKLSGNVVGMVFFALNPLVVVETLVSGHNDVVMMSLALGAFLLLVKRKYVGGVSFMAASIFIKYATLFLVPVYVYALIKSFFKQTIEIKKVFIMSAFCMLTIFLLSPLREEIYPWYAIWVIIFISLSFPYNLFISLLTISFSFGLMMRYVPFMLLGTHFGISPYLKTFMTFGLPIVLVLVFLLAKRLWKKSVSI